MFYRLYTSTCITLTIDADETVEEPCNIDIRPGTGTSLVSGIDKLVYTFLLVCMYTGASCLSEKLAEHGTESNYCLSSTP